MFVCEVCCGEYSSQSSLCNHRHRCPEMKNRGRPTNAMKRKAEEEKKMAMLREEAPTQEEIQKLLSPPSPMKEYFLHQNEPVGKKICIRTMNNIPGYWSDTYEKGLEMLEGGASENIIKTALKWDKCFKVEPAKLKSSLEDYYDYLGEHLNNDKQIINKDFREMSKDKQDVLKPILNPEGKKSKTMEQLLEDKVSLEKDLLYVNYGINLRKIYPSLKILKLMKSLVPEVKKEDVLATESQLIDDDFDPLDAKLASDEEGV